MFRSQGVIWAWTEEAQFLTHSEDAHHVLGRSDYFMYSFLYFRHTSARGKIDLRGETSWRVDLNADSAEVDPEEDMPE